MSKQNNSPLHYNALIQAYIQGYNHLNVEAMLQPLHPNVVFEHWQNGQRLLQLHGKAAFEQQAKAVLPLFTSRQQTIVSIQHDSHTAVIQVHYQAVWSATPPPGMQPGNTFEAVGNTEFEFADGYIILVKDSM
ncbi:MAG TPA: nuclear transport factor 2 family protein [Phnomibacter sp.]|nr:nuclear transport factor 2 family protein [Phnomibacter sp.]